jgi:hypothetical protein
MTTPNIAGKRRLKLYPSNPKKPPNLKKQAGLCERLRAITTTDHERLCQGREYTCSCGWDEENEANATEAANTIERQASEIERLRGALTNIQIEAEREEGRWVHLKRVIAINARAALTGGDQ